MISIHSISDLIFTEAIDVRLVPAFSTGKPILLSHMGQSKIHHI